MRSPALGRPPLGPGARLGPYEIAAMLGAGGMGEVYRARDARLGRDVAVKVIAFDASADPARLRRFEQEARAVAALNHPNILSVYDVGVEAGAPYLVFELLEGESLRSRLEREAVPQRKAVDWAVQIAHALAAAHDRGIVHRDLKPENVFVTREGRVKVLDFGLAKLMLGEETVAGAGRSSTIPAETHPGTVLGTAGYMSPEQVRGQAVDARSDLFSLGAVLYEMLAGRRAFRGDTGADTLTAILKDDPPALTSATSPAPPALERIVRRCLEKTPAERFQSARDLAFNLEALTLSGSSAVPAAPARWKPRVGLALAATLLLTALTAAAFLAGRRSGFVGDRSAAPETSQGEVRLQVNPPAGLRHVSGLSLSPDGRLLAFVATAAGGASQLWARPLGSLDARPLPDTEGARGKPFWSPDSRTIAFFTVDQLKRVDVSGGRPQTLWDSEPFFNPWKSGVWNRDGTLIFTAGFVVCRISASGGAAVPVTRLDNARREMLHAFPEFLPDGRHFLYFSLSEDPEHRGIRLGSLDSAETRPLVRSEDPAVYAPGYVLLRRGRALLAYPFDAQRLALTGEPLVASETVDALGFSASETGTLALMSSGAAITQPTWLDRAGRPLGTVGEAGEYAQITLSPDGRRAAVQRLDPRLDSSDIWLLDLTRGVPSRFTFDPGSETDPVWSPDGRALAFSAEGEDKGRMAIFVKELAGGAEERVLPKTAPRAFVEDWSRDGRFLFYGAGLGGRGGLWAVSLTGERKPFLVAQSTFPQDEPQLSPDGRWLAFLSAESGRGEVYVQAFPGPGPRARVSTGSGGQPRWRQDGRELFYLTLDGTLMAVAMKAGPALDPGAPRKLFSTSLNVNGTLDQYAVAADGQRFLFLAPVGETTPAPITVVLNWTAGLKR